MFVTSVCFDARGSKYVDVRNTINLIYLLKPSNTHLVKKSKKLPVWALLYGHYQVFLHKVQDIKSQDLDLFTMYINAYHIFSGRKSTLLH